MWTGKQQQEKEDGSEQNPQSTASADTHAEAELVLPEVHVDCVTLRYERHTRLPHPRLVIRTDGTPLTNEAVNALMAYFAEVLNRRERHTALWDLRSCATPTSRPLWRGIKWAGANQKDIDEMLVGVAILLNGHALRKVVEFVLWVTSPPMPQKCFGRDADAAFEFAASLGLASDETSGETSDDASDGVEDELWLEPEALAC